MKQVIQRTMVRAHAGSMRLASRFGMRSRTPKIVAAVDSGWELGAAGVIPADSREAGSTTVEYAIGAIATAGFAGLLVAVLKSGGVQGLIQNIIETALSL